MTLRRRHMITRQEFIEQVVWLQNEAGRLGLMRTLHSFRAVEEAYGRDCDPQYAKAKEKP